MHVCEHAGKMGTQNISQSPYSNSLMEMTEMMGSVKVPKVVFFKKNLIEKEMTKGSERTRKSSKEMWWILG